MSYNDPLTPNTVLEAMTRLASQKGLDAVSSTQLVEATGASLPAVKRILARLVQHQQVIATGKARATRYRLPVAAYGTANADPHATAVHLIAEPGHQATGYVRVGPTWRAASLALRAELSIPLAARTPVTYRREFADGYVPNKSALLPPALAEQLAALGQLPEQLPAGTYARKVLEQLLIDLSWSSSRLEGNRYTLLDTEELFKSGAAATDQDAVMLLNHKAAIEFLVDAVPTQGLSAGLLRNLHAVLMQDLLMDVTSLGAIRTKVVNISGTAFVPAQAPAVLDEMFGRIIATARQIRNPVESAFFLWVNLAYLQPFEDGNKRVSRLAANVPLMLYNQAPLSFLDVTREDYALAMMGVYERCDVSMAVDLFDWTYRRSQAKYKVVLESMGSPDPFRIRYRETLSEAVTQVVRGGREAAHTLKLPGLAQEDSASFLRLLEGELKALTAFNCARYRLSAGETQAWIERGRPFLQGV